MDPEKIVPDKSLSIREGAVVPWTGYVKRGGGRSWGGRQLAAMQQQVAPGELSLSWFFVIQRNLKPSHDTFLSEVRGFFNQTVFPTFRA